MVKIFLLFILAHSCTNKIDTGEPTIIINSPTSNSIYNSTDTLNFDIEVVIPDYYAQIQIEIVDKYSGANTIIFQKDINNKHFHIEKTIDLSQYSFASSTQNFIVRVNQNSRNYFNYVPISIISDTLNQTGWFVITKNNNSKTISKLDYNNQFDDIFTFQSPFSSAAINKNLKHLYINTGTIDGVFAYKYPLFEQIFNFKPQPYSLPTFFTSMRLKNNLLYVSERYKPSVKGINSEGITMFSTLNQNIDFTYNDYIVNTNVSESYVVALFKNILTGNNNIYAFYKPGGTFADNLFVEGVLVDIMPANGIDNFIVMINENNIGKIAIYSPYNHSLQIRYSFVNEKILFSQSDGNNIIICTDKYLYKYKENIQSPQVIKEIGEIEPIIYLNTNNDLVFSLDRKEIILYDIQKSSFSNIGFSADSILSILPYYE